MARLRDNSQIKPTGRGIGPLQAHKFLEAKLLEFRQTYGRYPTVAELLEYTVTASNRGEYRAPHDSDVWRTKPYKYFRDYLSYGISGRDIFEYVDDDRGGSTTINAPPVSEEVRTQVKAAIRDWSGLELGDCYTRQEINERLHGELRIYLPSFQKRIVCGCFDPVLDPDAPEEILVGREPILVERARTLVLQGTPIPVFLKRDDNRWEYVGVYRGTKYTERPGEVKPRAEHARRSDVVGILYLEACGSGSSQTDSPEITDSALGEVAAGFGDPETNKKVETAAINFVTAEFRRQGWSIESRERQRCGYDLHCRKGGEERHVEVKGVKRTQPAFIITYNEVARARTDPRFELWAVTNALVSPEAQHWSGKEFLTVFALRALQYAAVLRC